MPEKDFEFVLNRRDNIVVFNISFVLLLAKFDFILKKQGCKRDVLGTCSINYVKIIFALLIEIIELYIKVIIVLVMVPSLKVFILEYKVCFAIFLTFNKQF